MSTIPAAGLRLQFCTDPGEFLAVAGDYLAARPVVSTVVTTVAHRLLAQQADGIAQPGPNWWLVVWSESAVVGAGMRTAPFAPYPPFLLPMPDEAAGCGSGSPRPGSGCTSPASARPRSGWPAWARCTRRRPARARLGQQRRRRDLPADPGRGRTGVPVHRPGKPDLEQDLRRPRLQASSGHGQPCHRPLTPTDLRQIRAFWCPVDMYNHASSRGIGVGTAVLIAVLSGAQEHGGVS